VSKVTEIEARFQVSLPFQVPPVFNLGPGGKGLVVLHGNPRRAEFMVFGFTPAWAKKPMYLFNARAEGDHNPDNDPAYRGAMGIITKPAFRLAIRSRRCLVIADAFIEGSTTRKLDEPYLVHLAPGRAPFAFAGIWEEWVNRETGEVMRSFAIITTTPNELLQMIPHHRSPVILKPEDENRWLDPATPLSEITALLQPCSEYMNAWPISPAIKNPRANEPALLQPTGEPLLKTTELVLQQEWVLQGIGYSRARERE
jgi:putative SOS response-associated peptidase YedK